MGTSRSDWREQMADKFHVIGQFISSLVLMYLLIIKIRFCESLVLT